MTKGLPSASLARYALSGLAGAGLGSILVLLGSLREQAEHGSSALQDLDPGMRLLLPVVGGAIGGLVFASLRSVRSKGTLGFYLGWALSFGAGFAGLVAPEAVVTGEASGILIGVVLGLGSGLGAALFWRQVTAKPE